MNTLAKKPFLHISLIITLTALLLLFSCNKEEYEYPVVFTGEEIDMTEERIILSAYLPRMGNDDIVDYGFQINKLRNYHHIDNNSPKISLQSIPLEDSSFSTTLRAGMLPDNEYELRAYARTQKGTSYGNIILFRNIVDNPIQLDYFEPEMGNIGDTISIHGSYFNPYLVIDTWSWRGDENIVRFNERKALVIFASDSLLKVIVPNGLNETLSTISVEVRHTKHSFKVPFSLPQFTIKNFEMQ